MAVRSYLPQAGGEISLHKNERVRGQCTPIPENWSLDSASFLIRLSLCAVLSVGEGGYWEGNCRGQVGWFPARCLEEIPVKPDKERPSKSLKRVCVEKAFPSG